MKLNKFFLMLTFLVLLGTTAFAQTTWYVNNSSIGNDGRNGLSPTIPVPDDFITGPKKTINNVIASATAGDVIVIANTGVDYGTGSGEPATINVDKKLTFQSTGGTVNIASLLNVNTGALADKATFNSGAFSLKGGLTLTSGTLDNSSGLVTVSGGTITVAAASTTTKVTGQLAFSGTVNWTYNAAYTTGDEFPNAGGTINNFNTGAVAVTIKSGASVTVNGVITTGGTLNLGGNTWTVSGANAHSVGGNVTNGTLTFNMDGNASVAGAFTLPNVVATSSTGTPTLDLNGPTAITGTLTVQNAASVTSSGNTITTLGTSGFTGDVLVLSGTGTVNLGTALATVNGNVLLNSAVTTASGASITFGGAVTINGNVTNNATLTVSNAATWNGATSGRITFPDAAITITGNVVNNTSIGGSYGATTDVDGFGVILFQNTNTNVTINGAINNTSKTTLSGSTNPGDFSGNGLITWVNSITSGIVRADGGINNSSDFSGITGAANVNNGRIIIGGAARTVASTVGTAANRVGLITNSSKGRAAGDGNGNIIIGAGDGTSSGFFGTSINISGSAVGGYTVFGNENFNISGNITNSRTHASTALQVGTAGTNAKTITIGGNVVNQGTNTTSFVLVTTGAVGITGSVQSTANGTITWPNITTGAITLGGLSVSSGTITIPATNNANLAINGTVDISGGNVNLLADGGDLITIAGNASFTGGTITTTGRTSITLNSTNITIGGASTNPTFATAATDIIVGNPSPTALVNFTVGNANPIIAGNLTINNTTGLSKAVEFSGGSLRISGKLYFQSGKVNLAGSVNLIAQSNSGTNDFQNAAGYTSDDNARVTVNAAAPQVTGAGDFGNIEFNSSGTVDIGTPITITGTVYLTAGAVNNGVNNITFNNSTVLPTIVRNAGSFNAIPVFTSNVNVTYIGGDKTGGNELPASPSTKLQNLTVATTTGAVAGKGTVTVNTATIVNGTITVNANQALLIDGVTLTMKGASIVLNGDIANEAAGLLEFASSTGTTVTGSGYLPNLQIAAGSTGNVIAAKAIINQLLGTNNVRGGDDFDPTTTAANGTINFVSGTNSASFNLVGVAYDGSMVGNVTTNGTGNTLTLAGNLVSAGNLTHNAGTIDVATFTYEQRGASVTLGATGTASFTGTGLLKLYQADATTNTSFTLTSGGTGSTIGINVELNNADATASEDDIVLAGAPLTISGNLTITDGELVLNQNLTLTGSAFTIASAGAVSGASTLRLNAATPPMTFTYSGTPTISNLRISNDVNLAGSGTGLTISTSFTHDGGNLNFGSRNLTFQSAFTRSAGTYTATTGYMIIDANAAWTVDQGDGFSIPNLKFTASTANNLTLNNAAGRGTITVTGNLDYVMVGQTLTTNGKLAVADGATVNYTSGAISAAPSYAGSIKLVALNVTSGNSIPTNIWPSSPSTLVNRFVVNSAAAGNTVGLPGSRTVNQVLDLTRGTLALAGNTLTLVSGATVYRTENASVTKTTGGFSFPSDKNVTVVYQPTTASAGGDITTGIELPSELSKLVVTRSANVGNAVLTVGSAVTVNDSLLIRNDLTATAQVTAKGAVKIEKDNYTNATDPAVTFAAAAPLVFSGASGQNLVLSGNQSIAFLKIDMPGTNPVLNVTGGNLTIPNTGKITFINGILNMGTNALVLARPQLISDGLGYDRTAVTGTKVGHVVGKVQRAAATGDGQTGTNGRFEFPVGTLNGQYRPVSITFTPDYVVGNPVSIVVSHVDASPEGTLNLPLDGGNGVKIGNYPNFYWNITTTPTSLTSTQKFDIDLQANNIGVPYDNFEQLRLIRRQDGNSQSNAWYLQGNASNYQNIQNVTGTDTVVIVRTVSAQGGLVAQGSRFAIGVPSRVPQFTAPVSDTKNVDEGATETVQLTAVALNANETISYSLVSGPTWATLNTTSGLLTLKPGYSDASTTPYQVVVRATANPTGLYVDYTLKVTVINKNQKPVFTASSLFTSKEIPYGTEFPWNFAATDADGETLKFMVTLTPAPAGTYSISNAAGNVGIFKFTPTFADYNKTFTLTLSVTDDIDTVTVSTPTIKVIGKYQRGDANLSGGVADIDDAVAILKHVVQNPVLGAENLVYADANLDGVVNTLDASWILKFIQAGNDWTKVSKSTAAAGTVDFGKANNENGLYNLPISIANTKGVTSIYTEVEVNNGVEVKGISVRLPEGWISSSVVENGKVKFAAAGTNPLNDGVIANVQLKLENKEAVVSVVGNAKLNEEISASLNAKVREIPSEFAVSQNYPNPFNPTTTIKFAIANDARVNLVVYDMLGQKVRTLIDGEQEAGYYSVRWDGTNDFGSKVSSGIYIYRLQAGNFVKTMKMNLMK